jgi:hypothetical protein
MNEERNGKCLRQVKHVRGHFGHRGSLTVNQAMLGTQTAIVYTRNLYIYKTIQI